MVELAYKFDENSYLEKVSRSLKYDSIFIYIIYGDQHRLLYPARLRMQIIKEGCKKVR